VFVLWTLCLLSNKFSHSFKHPRPFCMFPVHIKRFDIQSVLGALTLVVFAALCGPAISLVFNLFLLIAYSTRMDVGGGPKLVISLL